MHIIIAIIQVGDRSLLLVCLSSVFGLLWLNSIKCFKKRSKNNREVEKENIHIPIFSSLLLRSVSSLKKDVLPVTRVICPPLLTDLSGQVGPPK